MLGENISVSGISLQGKSMSKTIYKEIQAYQYKAGLAKVHYADSIDHCPYCKHSMSLTPDRANYTLPYNCKYQREDSLYLFYQCRRDECQKGFIAIFKYFYDGNRSPYHVHHLQQVIPVLPETKEWPHEVTGISPSFAEIYNQAFATESLGYQHASGPTYRKSLEFLIKDYAISKNEGKDDEIKKKFLSNCINDYVESERIKKCAERAAWLGNDETHYTRRWEDKDIDDLKTLIKLTVNHIQDEVLTDHYMSEMEKK